MLRQLWSEVAGAVAFLTRLPVPGTDWSRPLYRLAAWFPLAGLVVGGLSGLAFFLAYRIGLAQAAAVWPAPSRSGGWRL